MQAQQGPRAEVTPAPGCCYRCCSRICCRCFMTLPERWPRSFALILGVVVPLFALILVSTIFGYGLARLEAPGEMETNDDVIATRAGLALSADFVTNLTRKLPHVCLSVYLHQRDIGNVNALNETLLDADYNTSMLAMNESHISDEQRKKDAVERLELERAIDLVFLKQYTKEHINKDTEEIPFIDEIEVVNTTDLMLHMDSCGSKSLSFVSQYDLSQVVDRSLVNADITFHWLRCDGGNGTGGIGLFNKLLMPYHNHTRLQPDAQFQLVMEQWRAQQKELYDEYYAMYSSQGMKRLDARWLALQRSFEEANGHSGCDFNWQAGAWFWFTIMSTIGYGNTAPVTDGARAMVFTLGFLSVLLFAAVLAKAGSILTKIVDDASDRLKLTKINLLWVGTLFWALLYCGWMCVIAAFTVYWKQERLDEELQYKDAYWFSYISTTTIGLGDYFLEHEVITRRDLIIWPLLMLIGFVLLSSFLNKLSSWIVSWFPSDKPKLEEMLENTDVPCFPRLEKKLIKQRRKERKEALISELMSQSKRVLNVEPLDDDDDSDHEDDERFEEFINEFKSVEANVKVNGDSWKGFVTRASPAREKA